MVGRGTVGAIVRPCAVVLVASLLMAACVARQSTPPGVLTGPDAGPTGEARALVFTRTTGWRHDSIPIGVLRLSELLPTYGYAVDHTEDPSAFTPENLARYKVVVFLNTTGDILDDTQQAALEGYVRAGGGYAGVHSAADTEHDWPWYGDLVGAFFTRHPLIPFGVRVALDSQRSLATASTSKSFSLVEEIYDFDRNPRATQGTEVLATIEPRLSPCEIFGQQGVGPLCELMRIPGDWRMGDDHPVAWQKRFDGGRSFYTNLGHMQSTWSRPDFLNHVVGGIRWAAGEQERFQATTLADGMSSPMRAESAPDGTVYTIERDGDLMTLDPEEGRLHTIGHVDVNVQGEQGLLGLALDPAFASNRTLYLYFVEGGEDPVGVLASFTIDAATGDLDLGTRHDLLSVPQDGDGHSGGVVAVDTDGNVLLGTGDNTTPFQSGGFAPIDDRPGHEDANALRTSGNPNDLRGKVLRVRPDGSIPLGNLFSGPDGRPEVWAMGFRNPFSLAVGPGRVFEGDVGPDAILDGSYGPRGRDELNMIEAGDYGWPRCLGDRRPYRQRDFATGALGDLFDCSATRAPALSYDYVTLSDWATGTGGRAIMAGDVVAPADVGQAYSLPDRLDGRVLAMDYVRGRLFAVDVDAAGAAVATERLAPDVDLGMPTDLDIGPDGALTVVDQVGGRLLRIEYHADGRQRPTSRITASELASADAPWTTRIPAAVAAGDTDDPVAAVHWEVDGIEVAGDADGLDATFAAGTHEVRLWAESAAGRRSLPHVVRFVAGNSPPTLTVTRTPPGIPADGDAITWTAQIEDTDVDPAACDRVQWQLFLVHNTHQHPAASGTGCTFPHVLDLAEHAGTPGAELSLALGVTYTDRGPSGTPADGATVAAGDTIPFAAEDLITKAIAVFRGTAASGGDVTLLIPKLNWYELFRRVRTGADLLDTTALGY